MVQILDLFHALEKLSAFAKVQYPNSDNRKLWVEDQKKLLLSDKVEEVIKLVTAATPLNTEAEKCKKL